MKLKISQKLLKDNLTIANRFVDDSGVVPVYKNILLATDDGKLKLAASSLAGTFVNWLEAEVEQEGEITIPAALLTNYVGTLKNDDIGLSLKDDKLTVRQGRSRSSITGLDAKEFPVLSDIPDTLEIELPVEVVKEMLNQVLFSVADDESRPILTGMNFIISNGKLQFTSATGFKAAIISTDYKARDILDESNITIPKFILSELARLNNTDKFELYPDDRKLTIKAGSILLSTSLIAGPYPDMSAFVGKLKETKTTIEIGRQELLDNLKSALLFAKEISNRVLLKFFENDTLELSTEETLIGHYENILDCKVNGESQVTLLNCQYLIDILGVITTENVRIYLIDSSEVVIVRDENEKLFTLIMPFSLKGKEND